MMPTTIDMGFGWIVDVDAAMREQFPDMRKLIHERPGSKRDNKQQALWHADNRLQRERQIEAAKRKWLTTAELESAKREQKRIRDKQAREYSKQRKLKHQQLELSSLKEEVAA